MGPIAGSAQRRPIARLRFVLPSHEALQFVHAGVLVIVDPPAQKQNQIMIIQVQVSELRSCVNVVVAVLGSRP